MVNETENMLLFDKANFSNVLFAIVLASLFLMSVYNTRVEHAYYNTWNVFCNIALLFRKHTT
jgi:hypothetical protein